MCLSGKKKWIFLAFAIVFLFAVGFLVPAGNRLSRTQILQFQSETQLKGISQLALNYKKEHLGNVPVSLSELLPEDDTNLLKILYIPKSPKSLDQLTNKSTLDMYADYSLSSSSNLSIVAYEKADLWSDNSVAVCYTNLDVERMSLQNFNALLGKK